MSFASRARFALIIGLLGVTARPQFEVQPVNDLPNPYRTVRDWGHPPDGAKWAAVTAVEAAPDGSIYVVHRCHDNSCAGRLEPPILKFSPSGKLLKSWVRACSFSLTGLSTGKVTCG